MAMLTAEGLRELARGAVMEAGLRGFVRFLPEGDEALLATDAAARAGEAERTLLAGALAARGLGAAPRGALLALKPSDALLRALAEGARLPGEWDWDGPLAPAYALAARWLRAPEGEPSPAGERLALETARLLWQPRDRVLAGLRGLRARAAAMQRRGDRSGLRIAGGMLLIWCARQDAAGVRRA